MGLFDTCERIGECMKVKATDINRIIHHVPIHVKRIRSCLTEHQISSGGKNQNKSGANILTALLSPMT